LIEQQGFGKPQKLETKAVDEDEAKGGGSKWNQAGTYEEKGMSKWVQDRMKEVLQGIEFKIPTGAGGVIKTLEIEDVKGDASISVSRGKRRHLLDVSCTLVFDGTVGDTSGKGKLLISEITTSADEDPEVKMEVNGETPQAVREVFDAFVKPAGQGLQPLILKELKNLVEEYKTK